MATHKSAEKRARQAEKHNIRNRHYRTLLRNTLRTLRSTIGKETADKAKDAVNKVTSLVHKLASKNIIHKNAAARYLSRLAKHLQPQKTEKTAR